MRHPTSSVSPSSERPLAPSPDSLQKYSDEVRELIAKTAYELYVRGGRRDGQDLDDWLKAEEIVMREMHGCDT